MEILLAVIVRDPRHGERVTAYIPLMIFLIDFAPFFLKPSASVYGMVVRADKPRKT